MIHIKRVYDLPAAEDGTCSFVECLWQWRVSKDGADLERRAREITLSENLKRWSDHDPPSREEFRRRCREENREHRRKLKGIRTETHDGNTLLMCAGRIWIRIPQSS
jgi:uncharacterized protein YeaO (DUF488 family)